MMADLFGGCGIGKRAVNVIRQTLSGKMSGRYPDTVLGWMLGLLDNCGRSLRLVP